jgi:hypothetical protein
VTGAVESSPPAARQAEGKTRLFARRLPLSDESLVGFVLRLADANGLESAGTLLQYVGSVVGCRLVTPVDLAANVDALRCLEELADLPQGALERTAMLPVESAASADLRFDGQLVGRRLLRTEGLQFCPNCLQESTHHRRSWLWAHAPVCTLHRSRLASNCHSCGREFHWRGGSLVRCGHCGTDIRTAPAGTACSPETVVAASAIQSWANVPFGSSTFQAEITQHELADVVAALLPPLANTRPEVAQQDSLPRRASDDALSALHQLGQAWTGTHFDSEMVVAAVTRRWYYLHGLKRPGLLESRWRRAARSRQECSRYGPMLTARAAAAFEDETSKASPWRPDRTLAPDKVARALEVSEPLLARVALAVGISGNPGLRSGYLKSQVERMHTWLQALYNVSELDSVLGMDGFTQGLTRIGLLRPFGFGYGHAIGYVPDDIAELYDAIASRVVPCPPGDSDAVCIGVRAAGNVNTAVELVARVAAGPRAAYGWQPPFRLVDLVS